MGNHYWKNGQIINGCCGKKKNNAADEAKHFYTNRLKIKACPGGRNLSPGWGQTFLEKQINN